MNISSWFDRNLERFGDYEALVVGDRTWAAGDLQRRTSLLAGGLVARGVAPGTAVILALPNAAEYVIAFTAVLRTGAVPVPVFVGASQSDVETVIRDCAPTAIITTKAIAARPAAALEAIRCRIATSVTTEPLDGWLDLDTLAAESSPLVEPVSREPGDAAVICYTSGTSGTPKGVVYTHGGVLASHRGPARASNGTVLMTLPLNAFGAWALTGRLMFRWKLVLLDTFEPRAVFAALEQHRVNTVPLVPTLAEVMVSMPQARPYDLSSLRRVMIGGAHTPATLVTRLTEVLGVKPTVSYGMTEVGGGIAGTLPTSKPGSVGRAIPGVKVEIVDDDGAVMPPGETGEVCVKTPWMGAGYIGTSVSGAGTHQEGWLRTGDLGYVDADGDLFILGRRKDIVIQGGVNVSTTEVNDVIARLPGVRECAAVGVPHQFLGEELVACVVRDDASLTDAQVIAHCEAHLDPRKVPVRVQFWDALPRAALGKVKTDEIRQRMVEPAQPAGSPLSRRLRAAAPRRRRVLVAEAIRAELCRVLHLDDASDRAALDETTPLGDLGLSSIRAARLAHGLGVALGRTVSPILVFSHPTIDALGSHLLEEMFGAEAARAPARAKTRRRPRMREPIAIVGIGCRLPGGIGTAEEFWTMLRDGIDATGDISRWNLDGWYDPVAGTPGKTYTRRAALLDDAHLFDAEFFGITDREAVSLDPQHRLALEVTWEAIEDAGYDPLGLADAGAGLFLGITGPGDGPLSGLGAAPSMAVGRICNFLDLRGPALAIDTTCSSSLAAVHAAAQSLRGGECDFAIAGGVNVIASPRSFVGLSELGVLAPDGRCKTFDAGADGFGRGEGCVMIALKRLRDAEADRCRVIAVIRGSAVRHDGRSSSLTAPNGRAQQAAIRAALADAAAAPENIDYLEAHGTGTSLGDPIEVDAAMAVLRHSRRVLLLGSVKTNIGHLEAAAGAAGVAKTALALAHAAVPPHLHYHAPNPLLAPLADSFRIPTTLTAWPRRPGRSRLAGVTSMGLSGTNVHVVLEEAPTAAGTVAESAVGDTEAPALLCLSATTGAALREQARQYAAHLSTVTTADTASVCFTATVGRHHFRHRLALVERSLEAARQRLLHFGESADARQEDTRATAPARIAFLFSGQGRQKRQMGRALYEREPVFRAAIDQCDEVVTRMTGGGLVEALYADTPTASDAQLESMALAQPAIFAVEWALTALWRSWGIEPDAVLGHSIGECVAACAAGVMSLEDGVKLAATRGRLLESLPSSGAMLAFLTDEACVRRAIAEHGGACSIAAVNGPQNVVVAGTEPALGDVERTLAGQGIESRRLHIPRAAHSSAVEPILDELEQVAATIAFSPARLTIASTLTGRQAGPDELSHAKYWRRHMREPVRFADAIAALIADGYDTFVEIGPHPVLITMGQDCVADTDAHPTWLASLRHDCDDREQMAQSLGRLYMRGVDPNWVAVHGHTPARRVRLPAYPFQRRAYESQGARGRPRQAPAAVAPPADAPRREPLQVSSPPSSRVDSLRAQPAALRLATITEHVRRQVLEIVGRHGSAECADDTNLLRLGMDSVRVVELVGAVSRLLGVACRPRDLVARPTIAAFAAYLASLVANTPRAEPRAAWPLVTLNDRGSRAPLFCFHPSGGEVTAYLRLRELVGDDRPLYAIQSRALDEPAREHPTLDSMAIDYATLVQGASHRAPYQLLGWSMGGVIAHAVAGELERRGAAVEAVGLIDPVALAGHASRRPEHDLAFAVTAVIHDTQREPPPFDVVTRAVAGLPPEGDQRAALLAWCVEREAIPAGALTLAEFKATIDLYLRHFDLTRQHRPRTIDAPIRVWWADSSATAIDATSLGRGSVIARVVGGTHFSIVRPPHLATIAADLAAAQSEQCGL